jgi:hypothetical protein
MKFHLDETGRNIPRDLFGDGRQEINLPVGPQKEATGLTVNELAP